MVLDALEREGDWVTNRATPGKFVLGSSLGGIESGVRQLSRTTPLETTTAERVARRAREAIRRSGMTQAEFAALLGTSSSRLP